MDKPKCKLCGKRHDQAEPHVFDSGPSRIRGSSIRHRQPVTPKVTEEPEVTVEVTHGFAEVTGNVTPTPLVTQTVTPGEECPTCGQKMPMSHAQRQAAYRGRHG